MRSNFKRVTSVKRSKKALKKQIYRSFGRNNPHLSGGGGDVFSYKLAKDLW